MEVVNESELHLFAKKHSGARNSLAGWLQVVRAASWRSFPDVRETFRSADYVKELVIFNIGGNNYRLLSSIDYSIERIYILEVMTHAQYDRWKA